MSGSSGERDPLSIACERVGRFLYLFSRVEMQLDAAIAKLFKLDPNVAPIVAANIDFVRKLYIVRSAVQYQNENTSNKISAVVDFRAVLSLNEKRQIIAHSSFEPDGAKAVQFKRTTAREKLLQVDPRWTEDDFEQCCKRLQALEADLTKMVVEIDAGRWVSALFQAPPGLPAYLVPFTDNGWLAAISTPPPKSEK